MSGGKKLYIKITLIKIMHTLYINKLKFSIVVYDARPYSGEKWRQRRKMVTSAFHPSVLKTYIEVVNKNSQALIENITSQDNEIIQDLLPFFAKHALRINCGNFVIFYKSTCLINGQCKICLARNKILNRPQEKGYTRF